jgi:hypothetical protein
MSAYAAAEIIMSSGGWTGLGACVTALVAVFAAVIGLRQLLEARRLREEQAQPQVVVFLDGSENDELQVDLVIKNFGLTTATDVRVKFSQALESANLSAHKSMKIISTPEVIPTLVPGQEWRTYWDFTQARAEAALPMRYGVEATFRDQTGARSFRYEFDLDWQPLMDRGLINVYRIHHAAAALRDIRQMLKDAQAFGGAINVVSRNGDKRDQRESDQFAWHQEQHEPHSES